MPGLRQGIGFVTMSNAEGYNQVFRRATHRLEGSLLTVNPAESRRGPANTEQH